MDAKTALDRMARSRVVLIGSATRGSDEFHRERAALITRDGFGAVASTCCIGAACTVRSWSPPGCRATAWSAGSAASSAGDGPRLIP
jgi:hypothetical protein